MEKSTTNDNVKMFNQEENIKLIKEYRESNDKEIINTLIEGNYILIKYISKKFYNYYHSIEFEDLMQECSFALYMAIKKYDISKEKSVKFTTYATKAMSNALINLIQSTDKKIRIPHNLENLNREYTKLLNEKLKDSNQLPTPEEIKEELGITDKQLKLLTEINSIKIISSNTKINEDEEEELESLLSFEETGYEDYENYIDSKILIKSIKDLLNPEEYYIFYNYYLLPEKKVLRDIADELLVSKANIGFIIQRINKKVKIRLNKNNNIGMETGEKLTIKEIENIDLTPTSPKEIACLYEIKNNCDSIVYSFLYNRIRNKYEKEDFKKEYSSFSDLEIEEIIEKCDKIKEEKFNNDAQNKAYQKLKNEKTISEIYKLDILPDSQSQEKKQKKIKNKINMI